MDTKSFHGHFTVPEYHVKGVEPYILEVEYSLVGGKVTIIGASLFRKNWRYYGWWDARQMPLQLVIDLKKAIRGEYAKVEYEIVEKVEAK